MTRIVRQSSATSRSGAFIDSEFVGVQLFPKGGLAIGICADVRMKRGAPMRLVKLKLCVSGKNAFEMEDSDPST